MRTSWLCNAESACVVLTFLWTLLYLRDCKSSELGCSSSVLKTGEQTKQESEEERRMLHFRRWERGGVVEEVLGVEAAGLGNMEAMDLV